MAEIGCSKRTIERLAAARKLEQRLRPTAGSPPVAVYNPDDVRRIALERRPDPAPFVLPAGQTPTNGNGHHSSGAATGLSRNRDSGEDPIRQLAAAFERFLLSPPSPPVAERLAETLYLSMADAAARAGLSVPATRRLIKARGVRTARDKTGIHVHRAELEALL